jgi:hexosaminidase
LVYTKNKTTIGWEEILNANIHSSTLAQVWINKVPNKNANPTIYSMCSSLYLDHANTPGQRNCATWCTSYISLEKVYNTNILTDNKLAIGLEAAVWTEKVEGDTAIDNRLWPRLLGVAEIAWSNPSIKNYQHFKSRVDYFGERLSYLGINFFKKDNEKVDYDEISIPYTNIFQNHIPVKP